MFRNLFLISTISVMLFGCASNVHHLYAPNKRQCISIITEGEIRYIIDGYHNRVPTSNFVKLDLRKVDRGAGDQIVGCWNRDNFKWVIAMDDVAILENKLDANRYKFINHFPLNEKGSPSLKGYIGQDCFSISLEYRNIIRIEGAIEE